MLGSTKLLPVQASDIPAIIPSVQLSLRAGSNSQPFFIVGCARSGTTMLQRLLNRHSQVCVPDETQFIPRKRDSFVKLWARGEHLAAVELLNSVPLVKKWQVRVGVQEIESRTGESAYARAIDVLMSRRAERDNKPRWGEKTPWYVLDIPLLARLYPEARFINIYRDGRDVALSVMPLNWGPNNAYSVAGWWKQHVQAWQRFKPALGDKAFEVRYEDFVNAPEPHWLQMCEFLELPYEEYPLERTRVDAGRAGGWRNDFNMTNREVEAFECAAGGVLSELGYERRYPSPHFPLWLRLFSEADNSYKRLSNALLRPGGSG